MDYFPQGAGPLAVDNPDGKDLSFPARLKIRRQQGSDLFRKKRVQVEHAVDGLLYGGLGEIRYILHGIILPSRLTETLLADILGNEVMR